jgi:hypothetical protein
MIISHDDDFLQAIKVDRIFVTRSRQLLICEGE